jgi:hypothetical protein
MVAIPWWFVPFDTEHTGLLPSPSGTQAGPCVFMCGGAQRTVQVQRMLERCCLYFFLHFSPCFLRNM